MEMKTENCVRFLCKCKRHEQTVCEDEKTTPCPKCGRRYIGLYNYRKDAVDVIEIKKKKG